jgi:hypothetical protein
LLMFLNIDLRLLKEAKCDLHFATRSVYLVGFLAAQRSELEELIYS